MNRKYLLFLIYGPSGTGKSSVLKIAKETNNSVTIHKKDTNRKPRKGEDISQGGTFDLNFVNDFKNIDPYEIIYRKYDHLYGVRKDLLLNAFKNKEIHFIIINDIEALKDFKNMHPEAKLVYIHTNPEDIPKNVQKREGVPFNERYERVKQGYIEFIENNTLFDHIIVNFWDIENSHRQLQNIIRAYINKKD